MLIKDAIKLPYEAFTTGKIHGFKVTRNPILWIPYFVFLPIILLAYMLFMLCVYPFVMVFMAYSMWRFGRKTIRFDEQGIVFKKAYGRRAIPWSEMEKVVYRREPTLYAYEVSVIGQPEPYIVAEFEKDKEFEAAIEQAGVPFERDDPLGFDRACSEG